TYIQRLSANHDGTITHHTGAEECWRPFLGAVFAAVGLEPQIALPENMRFPVRCGHPIGIRAISNRLNAVCGFERLEIGHYTRAHHSHHTALLCRLRRRRVTRLSRLFEKRQKIGALLAVLDSR